LESVGAQSKFSEIDNVGTVVNQCHSSVEVLETVTHAKTASIFLLADRNVFQKNTLQRFFTCISKSYSDYASLNVTIFSDRNNLEKEIKNYLEPPPDANPPVWLKKIHPAETGYYRAFYSRFKDEYFTYSPRPDKVRNVRVELNSRR